MQWFTVMAGQWCLARARAAELRACRWRERAEKFFRALPPMRP